MHKIMYVEYLVHKMSPTNASCYYCHKTASVCLLVTITTATRVGSLIYILPHTLKIRRLPGCLQWPSPDGMIHLRQGSQVVQGLSEVKVENFRWL